MVDISIENGRVYFDAQGWDKLWAMRAVTEMSDPTAAIALLAGAGVATVTA